MTDDPIQWSADDPRYPIVREAGDTPAAAALRARGFRLVVEYMGLNEQTAAKVARLVEEWRRDYTKTNRTPSRE